jgi:hypothetical protein
MINQKKAKKLRKLLGVQSRANRTYMTEDGKHHTQTFAAKHHKPIGVAFRQGAVTLSKNDERNGYQRIKRSGIAQRIINARAV